MAAGRAPFLRPAQRARLRALPEQTKVTAIGRQMRLFWLSAWMAAVGSVTPPTGFESRAATLEAQGRMEGGRPVRHGEAPFPGVKQDFSRWPSDTNGLRFPPPRKAALPTEKP